MPTIQELKLIEHNINEITTSCNIGKLLDDYKNLFHGIWKIKTKPCELVLKKNYETAITPCRKVPYQLLPLLEDELKTMVNDGIISKITEPTEFVNPIVVVRKPMARICLDPAVLNKAIVRELQHLPKFEELTSELSGMKYFTTIEEHDKILQLVLKTASDYGIKFNNDKSKFRVTKIKYVGHTLSSNGSFPDNDKIEAITQIPELTCAKELLRFLDMVTYVSKFIPNLSNVTFNLRQLSKKRAEWTWTDQHQSEFNHPIALLSNDPVLQYYNPKLPITLSVNSSKHGLGAVIIQNEAPIAYASKS
ncbi:hypothetical protein ILUMI_24829 [Ignelater luminosus]|uniref:Reverse transcriptase/retrotransposon-derived protein RNase H-like domain-containing protein n=1 Tax=Ignelater luminosus TaxID=2038154 RepID=A0A8K0C9Q8_IGNLU|nr:hypothetical protein ILUMI_24829 [Ignelater luminosus]